MRVLGGSAAGTTGRSLAKILGATYSDVELRNFPDSEFAVKVPFDAHGDDVVIVQSLYTPQERHLLELVFAASAIKEMGPASLTAVVPYMAYMRQNRSFTEGEAASANIVMAMLGNAGISSLITVQPHKDDPLSSFKGRSISVKPVMTLIERVAEDLSEPFVLAPDKGGIALAESASRILGCGYAHLDKERDPKTGVARIKNAPDQRFDDKQVVIVDDVISTGGTIAISAEFALSRGAKSVAAAAVHLVMSDGAGKRMADAGVGTIYGTNTIPCKGAKIADISGDIADAVKSLI